MKIIVKIIIVSAVLVGVNFSPVFCEKEGPTKEPSSITIADFNNPRLINNLNGESGTWEKTPEDTAQWITASLSDVTRRGESGSALKLEYSVDSPQAAVNGFWTQLRELDASKYDHFEFWVKGDDKKGFTTTFKIEFNKNQKDADGNEDTIKGSYIVKGVTDKWQKISVPLNVMNGILNWHGLREMVITFEKRRVDSPEGVLYFDDFAFVRTGDPGPGITDVVRHGKKKTEKELKPEEFARFLIARLGGFPDKVFIKKSFPKDDRAFLKEVARDTWKYFDLIVDKE
ncbi:MAG: carbohydrate binding domain-containing protein, partial [Candidatus Omnitrophica bacterium]|nr:carbohydrate binding domain-containing protein [Candidatus Omnitrophota bacterium]